MLTTGPNTLNSSGSGGNSSDHGGHHASYEKSSSTTTTSSTPSDRQKDDFERIARESRAFREAEAKRIALEKQQAKDQILRRKVEERERITRRHVQFLKQQQNEISQLKVELQQLRQQQRDRRRQSGGTPNRAGGGAEGMKSPTGSSYVADRAAKLQKQLEEAEERYKLEQERLARHHRIAPLVNDEKVVLTLTNSDVEHMIDDSSLLEDVDVARMVELRDSMGGGGEFIGPDPTAAAAAHQNYSICTPTSGDTCVNNDRSASLTNNTSTNNYYPSQLPNDDPRDPRDKGQLILEGAAGDVSDDDSAIDTTNKSGDSSLEQVEEIVSSRMSESDEDLARAFDQIDRELVRADHLLARTSSDTSSETDRLALHEYYDLMDRDLSSTNGISFNDTMTSDAVRQQVLDQWAESEQRTQEMLDEDGRREGNNISPQRGNTNDSPSSSSDSKDVHKTSNRSIAVHKYKHNKHDPSKNGSHDKDADRNDIPRDMVRKIASFEIPMELTDDGCIKLSPKIAELSMLSTIAPSRLDGRWSGTLEAKSELGNLQSSATGMATLQYISSKHTRLSLGTVRGSGIESPLVSLGIRYVQRGSSMGLTVYNNVRSIQRLTMDSMKYSLSFRHSFQNTRWYVASNLTQRQDLSMVVSNNKLSARAGVNLVDPSKMLMFRVDAKPKLSAYRRAHCYGQWKSGIWQFGFSLVQSLESEVATVGLGWRVFSTRGLEWVLSWSRGSSTIRIPILISKSLVGSSYFQVLYLTFVSQIIQDGIAHLWAWTGNPATLEESKKSSLDGSVTSMTSMKTREDATLQIELMERQAKRKAKNESERNGLVIKQAMYKVKDGDEWDVTVPVQFWVVKSSLSLPLGKKSNLLGFYNVSASSKKDQEPAERKAISKSSGTSWSLRNVLDDLLDLSYIRRQRKKKQVEDPANSPTLTVQYRFREQDYVITVRDDEGLDLPSPNAIEVKEEDTGS